MFQLGATREGRPSTSRALRTSGPWWIGASSDHALRLGRMRARRNLERMESDPSRACRQGGGLRRCLPLLVSPRLPACFAEVGLVLQLRLRNHLQKRCVLCFFAKMGGAEYLSAGLRCASCRQDSYAPAFLPLCFDRSVSSVGFNCFSSALRTASSFA